MNEEELLIESIQVPDGAVSRLEFQEFICMNDQKKGRREENKTEERGREKWKFSCNLSMYLVPGSEMEEESK